MPVTRVGLTPESWSRLELPVRAGAHPAGSCAGRVSRRRVRRRCGISPRGRGAARRARPRRWAARAPRRRARVAGPVDRGGERLDRDGASVRIPSCARSGTAGWGPSTSRGAPTGSTDRDVALKVIQSPLDGHQRARFVAERQILARLSHPGIAQLFDGGLTDEGFPYFTMEYVDGERIDRYCDDHELDIASRLRIFGHVCEAVAAAHRSLVVHRDLKPSNILTTPDGASSSWTSASRSRSIRRSRWTSRGPAPSCSRRTTRAPSRCRARRSRPPPTCTRSAPCSISSSPASRRTASRRRRRPTWSAPSASGRRRPRAAPSPRWQPHRGVRPIPRRTPSRPTPSRSPASGARGPIG